MANKIYPDFTAGSFAATKIFLIADPVTGVLVKVTLQQILDAVPSGVAPFLPVTGTGTATGAVTGELAGNVLLVTQGGNEMLHLDPTAGSEHAHLQAINTTDDDNVAFVNLETDNTTAVVTLSASFNNGVKENAIQLSTDATTSTIAHSADTHTFTGGVILSDLSGGGTTGASIDNDGNLIRTP